MTAASPAPERRRPRPGSLERPVNGRLYRGTWLLVGLPILLLAFSVSRPPSLTLPGLPPAFDRSTAATLANDLAFRYPDRLPGTPGAAGAATWFQQQLEPYGFSVRRDTFTAMVRGRRTELVDLVAEKAGLSAREIVVMAHRDDSGIGSGLDDNATGTAALIELARSYAPTATAQRTTPPYSLVFVSTDGAEEGALGAAHFAAESQTRESAIAVINLDTIAGTGRPRLEFGGDSPRSPAPGLLETLRTALTQESGGEPSRPSGLEQLLGLAFPFNAYEQAPFVSRSIPAVTVTTGGERPPADSSTGHERLNLTHLGQVGLAVQETVDAMEQGVALSQGPASYVFLGQRLVRGWAIEIVLVAMLLPFIVAAVDLFARCRRRRIRVAPALRSYRSRLWLWVWVGALFLVFAAFGFWGRSEPRPPSLNGVAWPAGALVVLGLLGVAGWLVARDRLLPRRPIQTEERLAGHAAALLALAVVGLLVAATNPFALLLLLPCLHFWLWLPQVQSRPVVVRAAVVLLGLLGPAVLVWSFATHYGLGWDAPWYIAKLFAIGYAPPTLFVIALAWLAAAGQLIALTANRYAPYPGPRERSPRGPVRELIRTLVIAQRRRAHDAGAERTIR
ncbi:MAG TPA: M28 family peptidase [Gaiellaceae bacterium]|nr:M28 family peptidase [Gaiellaceae bacterium]